MALVQMRTPGGSYSMVDEKVVPVYEAEGWVLTSELPEFKTKDVTYYDERRETVISSKGEEKPVEEVIEETYRLPSITSKKEGVPSNNPGPLRFTNDRQLTGDEFNELKKVPIEEKTRRILELANQGIFLSSNQKFQLEKTYNLDSAEIKEAEDKGKAGQLEVIESGPLKPGEAGYGIDTWFEFLGYDTEDDAMRDFQNRKLTAAQIKRAAAEVEPDPADIIPSNPQAANDARKILNAYQVVVYKNSESKKVDVRGIDEWLKNGWSTQDDDTSDNDTRDDDTSDDDTDLQDSSTTSQTRYIVVGSPPNYTIQAVNSGDAGYDSAMTLEAAESTAKKLNDEFLNNQPVGGEDDLGEPGGEATGGGATGGPIVGSPGATKLNQFNNIPEGAVLVQSDEDRLYLMYTVPGAGTMYKGLPIRMFYEVKSNDLYKAGILTADAPYEINYFMTEEEIDDFIVAGNTAELPGNDPNTGQAPHPFLSFVDNLTTQAQIAPWLLDKQSISLLAEAALEGREVSEAEWRVTDWYQEHSEAEREWLRLYNADPSTATAQKNDYKIQVSRALQAAGVTGGFDSATGQEKAPPDALVSWIADKWVSGTWSESQTSEQIALFADPFRSGVRDTDFTTYLSTAGVDGLERTAEKEDRIKQLYTQYLGPVFGKLSDAEVSQKAGRLRNDTDYEAALIEQLKNNRLGLFPKYTNPELTYEDIVTPWRNLTTSVWGEAADETQSWWQDMVGTNDFTSGTATLRSKGLEIGNNQVTIEATEALQSALGDGSALQNLGANQ